MLSPEQRRWALAFALLELGRTDELPVDEVASKRRLALRSIDSREQVLAYFRQPRDRDAYEISRLIAVAAHAASAGFIDEPTAWHVIWAAATLAQRAYTSWRDYAEAYEHVYTQITDGRASEQHRIEDELSDPASPWCRLPWDLMGASVRPRVLRVTCSTCGAPRTRPSPSAYVYCDHCGGLVDYDFSVALAQGIAAPGPVYETLRAELGPALDDTHARGDVEGHRALQRRLFEAWVDACPASTPVRTRDPEYRERYVAWLAEAATVAAFDATAREREAAMRAATEQLAFAMVGDRPRVAPAPFRALVDCVFAYEAHRDALFEPAVYALHPDGAPRALQRRIGNSLFVQAWLPYLGEDDAQALLARTELLREYDELPPPTTRALPCHRCGGPLEIVDGARRVVCEHCGRLVDIVG